MATLNPGFNLINGKNVIDKDPDAKLDYYWILTDLLEPLEVISSIVVAVTGGLVVVSQSHTDDIVTVWLRGGNKGRKYASCTVSFVTSAGREDDRTAYFNMVEK